VRGYAYFTLPPQRILREAAERRLHVIQSLDELGAGFQLASHDLDIRGAGNLLGDEQSGHVREVGFELYNHLLEEAVKLARQDGEIEAEAADWSPQITIDAAALIPDSYIEDLDLRLQMYRRLAGLDAADDIEAFAAELIDRFGPIPEPTEQLRKLVPEVRIAVANGRMAARQLEDVMAAFYDHKVDLLVTTNIIESGLDIPTANTLIVHRADRFGLSQLYQLRGRVGRGKVRGYAYFTLPPQRILREAAERRLHVIQSLDELGAGFQLASHDLDIRGAGNLLGDEQSGHVREVGFELYNHLLEEAVKLARQDGEAEVEASDWSPQITIDAAALIPDSYIEDLDLRLQMYRRLAALDAADDIEAFAAELIDRFGPIPEPTEQLLQLVGIKQLCRKAGVSRVEAGPKGVLLGFHNNTFARPERLVGFIAEHGKVMRLRSDHRLVIVGETKSPAERLKRVRNLVQELVQLAAA
jgi:transcription-repair coupling factor (superfamily II helicase)